MSLTSQHVKPCMTRPSLIHLNSDQYNNQGLC